MNEFDLREVARARFIFLLKIALCFEAIPAPSQTIPYSPFIHHSSAKSNSSKVIYDILYAQIDSYELKLDLYLPSAEKKAPVIVWIHGGAFVGGDKAHARRYAPAFARRGFAVASVNYRLLPVRYPAQIHDVKGAIRFLRAQAHVYNLDPEHVAVLGTSAGGILACQVGVSCGYAPWEGTVGGNENQSSCVQAVVNCFGSVSYENITQHHLPARKQNRLARLLGCSLDTDTCWQKLKEAIPEFHLDKSDPPFLILHGAHDRTIPVDNSRDFDRMLQQAGVSSTLIVDPRFDHDTRLIYAHIEEIVAFLNTYLKPNP
ncbi:MAG: alpha/beta hydrolase [Chitinophagales bacterium]|nr:alpha/beta hydrolase [Chitinophagales bacterium]MDW8427203.1 alpha/beta hydrolase [Chitinophagales bacterium]